METKHFEQALYCLSASETIFSTIGVKGDAITQLEHNISSYWGKLYASFLIHSKEILDNKNESNIKPDLVTFKGLQFTIPPRLGIDKITTTGQAMEYFRQGLTFFEKSRRFFILDGYVTEHFGILQEIATLYDGIIAFSNDPLSLNDLLVAKVSLFEPLLNELNPNHFHAMIQQILYTCGEIYESLSDLTFVTHGEQDIQSNTTAVQKLNGYSLKAITFYERFLKSIEKDSPTDQLDEGYIQPFFFSLFSIAKLSQRYVASSKASKISFYERSISCYRRIQILDAKYKPNFLKMDLSLCSEIIGLLEESVKKLRMIE